MLVINPIERLPEPSTPQQALDLFTKVGTLTTLVGNNFGDRNTFGSPLEEVPVEISTHFPEPSSSTDTVTQSVYIGQLFDRSTGQPKRSGVLGMVSFSQHDRVDSKLMYAAHVNYHIVSSDDGVTLGIERHVTNTEHGIHRVREARDAMARIAIDPIGEAKSNLQKLLELADRLDQTRPVERAHGLFEVTAPEAEAVIKIVKSLIPEV